MYPVHSSLMLTCITCIPKSLRPALIYADGSTSTSISPTQFQPPIQLYYLVSCAFILCFYYFSNATGICNDMSTISVSLFKIGRQRDGGGARICINVI